MQDFVLFIFKRVNFEYMNMCNFYRTPPFNLLLVALPIQFFAKVTNNKMTQFCDNRYFECLLRSLCGDTETTVCEKHRLLSLDMVLS